jgi:hypothetical protein
MTFALFWTYKTTVQTTGSTNAYQYTSTDIQTWPDHTSATALDGHGISQKNMQKGRGEFHPNQWEHRKIQHHFSVPQIECARLVRAITCSQACQQKTKPATESLEDKIVFVQTQTLIISPYRFQHLNKIELIHILATDTPANGSGAAARPLSTAGKLSAESRYGSLYSSRKTSLNSTQVHVGLHSIKICIFQHTKLET